MKVKRALVLPLAGLLAAGAVSIVTAPAAEATPTGCTVSYLTSGSLRIGAHARCTGGSGQYRVATTCTDELRGSSGTYYGAWVGIGSYSSVTCPNSGGTQWLATNAHLQTR
jgi:hypothetical protein